MISRFFRFILGVIGVLIGLALTCVLALDQFYPQNPWTGGLKGQALVLLWDRQSPLACSGNAVMVLEDRTLERTWGPLFEASGRCQLRLQGVRAKAPRVLVARDDARVVIAGGRLEATGAVLELSGNAVVVLDGAELIGQQQRDGAARIEGRSAK